MLNTLDFIEELLSNPVLFVSVQVRNSVMCDSILLE